MTAVLMAVVAVVAWHASAVYHTTGAHSIAASPQSAPQYPSVAPPDSPPVTVPPPPAAEPPPAPTQRVFTIDELAGYNGTDPAKPLLLAVIGEVYDVTTGFKHYGGNTGYSCFIGRDASAAFTTGKFAGDGLTSDLSELSPDGIDAVVGWRDFYATHETYKRMGVLAERYYDDYGRPTPALVALNERIAEIRQNKEDRKKQLDRYVMCNSKSVMAEPFFTIWCDNTRGGPKRYPRELVLGPQGPGAGPERRCVCATKEQFTDNGILEYPDCKPLKDTCQRTRPKPQT